MKVAGLRGTSGSSIVLVELGGVAVSGKEGRNRQGRVSKLKQEFSAVAR